MRKLNGKIISVLLALVLLLTILPISTIAAGALFIENEQELIDAASNGGEYTLTTSIDLDNPLAVSTDLTLNLNGYVISPKYDTTNFTSDKSLFEVSGATLTLNGASDTGVGQVSYYTAGSPFKLTGVADKATTVIINSCDIYMGKYMEESTEFPDAFFKVNCPSGAIAPEITLKGIKPDGSMICYCASGLQNCPLIKGDGSKVNLKNGIYECGGGLLEGNNNTVIVGDNFAWWESLTPDTMIIGDYNNIIFDRVETTNSNQLSGKVSLLNGNFNQLTLRSGSFSGTGSLVEGDSNTVIIDLESNYINYQTALISGKHNTVTVENGQIGDEYMSLCPALLSGNSNSMTVNSGSFALTQFLTDNSAGILKIKGGQFNIDPTDYLDANTISYKDYSDKYYVLSTSATMSDRFKSYLNNNGELEINHYEPTNEEEIWSLVEELGFLYSYDENWEPYKPYHLEFNENTYDINTDKIYVSLIKTETDETIESHLIKIIFNYDLEMKSQIDSVIKNIVDTTNPYETTTYNISDIAIFNYWLTCTPENSRINSLIRFSENFQEKIGYKNFGLDVRMGADSSLLTEAYGIGKFSYNGTVYGVADLGVSMQHILYVPEGSEDLMAAAQARLDAYLGEGKVTLSKTSVANAVLRTNFNYGEMEFETYEEYREAYPNADDALLYYCYYTGVCWEHSHHPTFDDYKNYHTDAPWEDYIAMEGVDKSDTCYETVINGVSHFLLIKSGTAEQMKNPTYKNVDVSTNIAISSDESSVPLDTMLQVEKLTEGTTYNKITWALGTEGGEIFDIKLHSNSLGEYVTKLENGKFEVKLPVPAKFEDKELMVYYVATNGKVTKHQVTVNEGFATFTTDHFSAYTLFESINIPRKLGDVNNDGALDICDIVKADELCESNNYDYYADMNEDEDITISDIKSIVKFLLNF